MALSSELRSTLEKAIVSARDAAETASGVALGVLAVDAERAPDAFDDEKRRLRVALRAEARQLGGFERLVEECAYEQWHRMLFARFLAENDLLIHPEHGVAVTLADCEEIARSRGGADLWIVASEFASQMLPGVFRSDDPVLRVTLAPEGQQRLEEILAVLPREIFTSEDGLGWVYQYWQAKKKKEVNASERKIGGADIAPVTQLFTENYMVRFLLENTLGAWWTSRHPESSLVREWEYLRFDDDGKPAAGSFPGWPEAVADVTVMDPCCGSGHFLVVAFEMLQKVRVEAEGLSGAAAGDAVLRDNLFGLELDPRCTQIAAFALALQAWKTGGYRELPIPNIACSGISAKGRLEDWKKLARGDERLERSLERLHALFSDAADLGSLIDPLRETDGDLLVANFKEIEPLLGQALGQEASPDPSAAVFGSAIAGALNAAHWLAREYVLVTTNPPFLGLSRMAPLLQRHVRSRWPAAAQDLATVLLARWREAIASSGTWAWVLPHTWLFLPRSEPFRRELLTSSELQILVHLGEGAFESSAAAGGFTCLAIASEGPPGRESFEYVSLTDAKGPAQKKAGLYSQNGTPVDQKAAKTQRAFRLPLGGDVGGVPVGEIAITPQGIKTGDDDRYRRKFWEVLPGIRWQFMQSTVRATTYYGGREHVVDWQNEGRDMVRPRRDSPALGRHGVAVSLMRDLDVTLYTGERFDSNLAPIVPHEPDILPALWAFASSPVFHAAARSLEQGVKINTGTLGDILFEPSRWLKASEERSGATIESPSSPDPSQWLFDGSPSGSEAPLQVATLRLAGYRWPRQAGSEFPDCPALGPDGLESIADEDGIVCIPSVRGERQAAERLRALLAAASGQEWSPAKEADLLAGVGYAGKSLEQWLRDGFFEQHCQLFHHRPFVWQIWDGKKDGFSALVNYHRLDRANLEKLVYTYLGVWIRQQREAASGGNPGADARLGAAQELQDKLELILEGEAPYDIFVRWKPIEEQPLGWEPDLNDGVRLNIRPLVMTGVLRKTPKINWGKDRGKDPESAPWYHIFKGDRINDHHLTLAEKRVAREVVARRASAS